MIKCKICGAALIEPLNDLCICRRCVPLFNKVKKFRGNSSIYKYTDIEIIQECRVNVGILFTWQGK